MAVAPHIIQVLPPDFVRFIPFFKKDLHFRRNMVWLLFVEKRGPTSLHNAIWRRKHSGIVLSFFGNPYFYWLCSVPILFAQKSVTCAVIPPLSQKGALSHLFSCKCLHDGSLSLSPFCEYAPAAHENLYCSVFSRHNGLRCYQNATLWVGIFRAPPRCASFAIKLARLTLFTCKRTWWLAVILPLCVKGLWHRKSLLFNFFDEFIWSGCILNHMFFCHWGVLNRRLSCLDRNWTGDRENVKNVDIVIQYCLVFQEELVLA